MRVGCFALLGAALSGCGSEVLLPTPTLSQLETPPALLRGVDFDGFRAADHEVEVRAVRAEINSAEGTAALWDVTIRFEEANRGPVEVRAGQAELELDSDDFLLSGPVEGSIGGRERFVTADLRYQREAQRLWTDQPARLEGPRTIVSGDGMEIDLETRRLRLLGDVRAEVRAEPGRAP